MNTTITIQPTITLTQEGEQHRATYTIEKPLYYSFSTIADTATAAVEKLHQHLQSRNLI